MKTLQYTTTMKQFFNKADQLTENIEMGFYTKNQALSMLRSLRNEILDKFEEGSDEFMQCIQPLIDAHEIAMTFFGDE